MSTTNQRKFQNNSPIQQILIGKFRQNFLGLLSIAQPSSILEVGCGEGYLLNQIHQAWPAVSHLGLDTNPNAIEEGRKLFPELQLRAGDIYHLNQGDRSWDVVVASEVLEHLDRPHEALAEIKRVTKRYALLSVPHEPWFRVGNLARGRHLRRLGNHPEHVNLWSRKSFVKFVGQHLTVQTVKSAFPWTLVLAKA